MTDYFNFHKAHFADLPVLAQPPDPAPELQLAPSTASTRLCRPRAQLHGGLPRT
jgi:hypothetical protein